MKHACLVFLLLWMAGIAGAQATGSVVSVEQYHPHDFALRAAPPAGNPFDVELRGEFTGPANTRLVVPGFYDGDGVWKIRFSATRPGRWRMKTGSSLVELSGKSWEISAAPNRQPEIHGGLRVDPARPFHFVWEDGARHFLLGYECDWLWALDLTESGGDPELPKTRRLVESIRRHGFNHVILNVYAHDTNWSKGRQNQWDYGPPALYAWEGTNDTPDHSRPNPKFFQHYDRVVDLLHRNGIVAHIMLKVYNKLVNWPAPGSPEEEKYFRYLAARYQAYGNVVWDFSKEAYYEKDEQLQKRLLALVRRTDAYRRLLTVHDDDAFEWDPALGGILDFRSDQQHTHWAEMVAFDRNFRKRPVVNVEFGYERGVETLPTYRVQQDWPEVLRRAYLIYLAGGYGAYYYSNTAWDLVKFEPEPPGYARFKLLKDVFTALPYWEMEPAGELAVGGPCLARRGSHYLCYVEGAQIRINLTSAQGPLAAEWIDTWTGTRRPADAAPGRIQLLSKPKEFSAPALLVVKKVG